MMTMMKQTTDSKKKHFFNLEAFSRNSKNFNLKFFKDIATQGLAGNRLFSTGVSKRNTRIRIVIEPRVLISRRVAMMPYIKEMNAAKRFKDANLKKHK